MQIHNKSPEININKLELFGINGMLIKKEENTLNIHEAYHVLNVAELAPGLYMLAIRLLTGDGKSISKVYKIIKF